MFSYSSLGINQLKSGRCGMLAALLLAGGAFTPAVHAQNITWTGNSSTAWSNGANWLGGVPPANDLVTNIAQFSSNLTLNSPNVGTTSVAGIYISSNFTGFLTFNGTSLSLGASGISVNSGNPTFNTNLVAAVSQTWTGNGTGMMVNGNITIGANQTLTLASTAGGFTVNGAISESGPSGNLAITNAGNQYISLLAINSTYTGQTTVQQGNLLIAAIANVGAVSSLGAPTGANSVINLNSGAGLTISTGISNRTINLYGSTAGNVTLSGLGGASGYVPVTLNGLITVTGDAAHTLVLSGSTLVVNTLSSVIPDASSNPTSLTLSGGGGWILTGNNTYTGPTSITAGALYANNLADAGVPSSLGAASGANAVIQLGTALASQSQLIYTGAGASSNRPFNLFSPNGANYVIDSAGTGPLTLSGNITSNALATSPYRNTLMLSASARQTNVFSGAISDSTTGNLTYFLKSGPGTWVLSGANTYTGSTYIQAGSLVLDLSANPGGVINPASNLMQGGWYGTTLPVNGTATGSSGQTLSSPAFGEGAQVISINPNGGTGTTLTLTGNWTGSSGSALNLVLPTNAFLSANAALTSNLIADPTSKCAYVIVNGNNFATVASGNNNVVEYTNYTSLANNSNNSTLNYQLTGNLTHNGGAWAMNVLKLAPASAGTLDLGGGTATLAGQAVLFTGNQNYTVTDGTLGAANSNLLFHQYGTGVLTINSALGGGTTTLTKAGPGTLVIASANNSYTGVTGIYGGVLSVTKLSNGGVNSSIGASNSSYQNLILDGGTLRYIGAGDSSDRGLTLGFNGGTIDASGTGPLNLTANNVYPSQPIYTNTPGQTTLTLAGNNTGNNTLANRLFDSTTNSFNGSLNLVKSGSGEWVLTNNAVSTYQGATVYGSTYSGATNINGGALVQAAPNAVSPNSNIVFNGGVLGLAAGNFTDSLGTGPGQVEFAGSGGFAAYGAARTVNIGEAAATMTWGAGNFIPNGSSLILGYVSANATVTFQNPIDLNGATRTIEVDRGTGFPDAVLSGAIGNSSGTAGFTKTGTGVLSLAVGNSYNGPTNVNGGVLLLSAAGAIPAASNTNFNGGVLGLAAGNFTDSLGTGAGQVQFTGSGGFAAYGGNRTVNIGGASATMTWNSAGFVPTGSTLILGSSTANATVIFQNPLDLNGATQTIEVDRGSGAQDAVLSGNISSTGGGGLTLTGNGILALTGINSYTGGTNLNGSGGILQVSQDANLGAATGGLSFNGGTLQWTASFALSANRSLVLNGSGGTLDTQGFTGTVSGNISGPGPLTKNGSGTLILSGNDTYGGSTTVNGGALQLNSSTALPSGTAVTLTSAAANALNLNGFNATLGSLSGGGGVALGGGNLTIGTNNASTAYSGNITGNGSLTKTGSGTTTLSGNNTFTGATAVNQGTLKVTGYLNNSTGITVQPAATFDYENASAALLTAITNDGGTVIMGSGATVKVAAGSSYAGYQSTMTGDLGTQLQLLAGAAGAINNLTATWRARNAGEGTVTTPGAHPPLPTGIMNLISDVATFSGTGSDLYVLQLSYNPAEIRPGLTQSQMVAAGLLYLAYNSGTYYVNAVNGNSGTNNASPAQQKFLGSFSAFQTLYGTTLSNYQGAYGVDPTNDVAWAVVNHSSDWAVVPEPGSLALLACGTVTVLRCRRKRKIG